MSFNNTQYEYPYGFELLDNVHNFFPELLYDETLFRNDLLYWVRHRIEHMFPNIYSRQMNSYRLYQQLRRHRDYAHWRNRQSPQLHIAEPMPQRQMPSTSTSTSTPGDGRRRVFTGLPRSSYTSRADIDILGGLLGLSSLIQFEDVPVIPTMDQINVGSALHAGNAVSPDAICSICQEHGNANATWRILYCNHAYHQVCVDRWFQENTYCPVCRADIRNAPTVATTDA